MANEKRNSLRNTVRALEEITGIKVDKKNKYDSIPNLELLIKKILNEYSTRKQIIALDTLEKRLNEERTNSNFLIEKFEGSDRNCKFYKILSVALGAFALIFGICSVSLLRLLI